MPVTSGKARGLSMPMTGFRCRYKRFAVAATSHAQCERQAAANQIASGLIR
jgi:hypothetical protein